METCQLAEGIHYIPKGSEYCECGRTSRTFPDPRDLDAWRSQRDSVAKPAPVESAREAAPEAEPAMSLPAPAEVLPEAEVAAPAPEATTAEAHKPKKSRSKAAPPAPAAPTTP